MSYISHVSYVMHCFFSNRERQGFKLAYQRSLVRVKPFMRDNKYFPFLKLLLLNLVELFINFDMNFLPTYGSSPKI